MLIRIEERKTRKVVRVLADYNGDDEVLEKVLERWHREYPGKYVGVVRASDYDPSPVNPAYRL